MNKLPGSSFPLAIGPNRDAFKHMLEDQRKDRARFKRHLRWLLIAQHSKLLDRGEPFAAFAYTED